MFSGQQLVPGKPVLCLHRKPGQEGHSQRGSCSLGPSISISFLWRNLKSGYHSFVQMRALLEHLFPNSSPCAFSGIRAQLREEGGNSGRNTFPSGWGDMCRTWAAWARQGHSRTQGGCLCNMTACQQGARMRSPNRDFPCLPRLCPLAAQLSRGQCVWFGISMEICIGIAGRGWGPLAGEVSPLQSVPWILPMARRVGQGDLVLVVTLGAP